MPALAFLTKIPVSVYALLLVVFVASLFLAGAKIEHARLTHALKTANATNAALTQRLADANASFSACQASVDTAKRQGQEATAAANQAIEEAARQTLATQRHIADLRNVKPAKPDDLCQSALDLMHAESTKH